MDRKYEILFYSDKTAQTIIAETQDVALKIAKVNKGYKETDIVLNYTREVFYGAENIEERCIEYYSQYVKKPIEMIEIWIGCETSHLEIIKPNGFSDIIHFKDEEMEIVEALYDKLALLYNREITPLEKYHASF
jgi:hypothetical protein